MRIGLVAAKAGVAVDTVRYYERQGLLPSPSRLPSGYRTYSADDLQTLCFIRRSKTLGFTLKEIRELLRLSASVDADRSEVFALAQQRLTDVEQRLHELETVRTVLADLVKTCSGHGPVAGCPIIERVLGDDNNGISK